MSEAAGDEPFQIPVWDTGELPERLAAIPTERRAQLYVFDWQVRRRDSEVLRHIYGSYGGNRNQLTAFRVGGVFDLALLSQWDTLEQLCIDGCGIANLEFIEQLHRLRKLILRDTNIGPMGAAKLTNYFPKLERLELLGLKGNSIQEAGVAAIAGQLERLPRLKTLNLEGNRIGSTGTLMLASHLNKVKQLESLNLSNNGFLKTGAAALDWQYEHLTRLKSLDLEYNDIGPIGASWLMDHINRLECLESLNLSDNGLGETGVEAVARKFKSISHLKSLNLGGNGIGPKGATKLAEYLPLLERLESLDLWDNRIEAAGVEAIAPRFVHLSRIKTLDLGSNCIGPTGAESLAVHLPNLKCLESLDLWKNDIQEGGVAAVARQFQHISHLKSLFLGDNNIGPTGAINLAEHIPKLERLESLNLGGNDIQESGMAAVAQQFQHISHLKSLFLGDNDIGPTGAIKLAGHIPKLKRLESLDLYGNTILQFGLEAVAQQFEHLSRIYSLVLGKNHIRPEGAIMLAEHLPRLKRLESLDLSDNEIDDRGIRALAKAFFRHQLWHLREVDFRNNPIDCIEKSLLDSRDAKRIFRAVLKGVELPHARVMLVGMGGVGKSWLLRKCFLKDPVPPQEPRKITDDIDFFQAQDCKVSLGQYMDPRQSQMETTIWDFGGQAVKHGVHEGFFTDTDQRTVYLLVASARQVPGTGPGEADGTTGNRIVYWLRTLGHFVGKKQPVVIAITQCDNYNLRDDQSQQLPSDWQKHRPIDEKIQWRADLPPMKLTETPPELLRDIFQANVVAIVDGCKATPHSAQDGISGNEIQDPKIEDLRLAVARAIEQHTLVLKAKVPANYRDFATAVTGYIRQQTWSQLKDFRNWCKKPEVGLTDEGDQNFLLPLLNAHGRLFHFGRLADQQVDEQDLPAGQRRRRKLKRELRVDERALQLDDSVVHPGWLKHCVYRIVNRSQNQAWFQRKTDIQPLVESATQKLSLQRQSEIDELLILEFLEGTELCWKANDRLEYLFPRGLLSANSRDGERWRRWPCAPLEWEFLPEANFFRLMVLLHQLERGEQRCVVTLPSPSQQDSSRQGQYQHGRNWVHIRDLDGGNSEAVLLAFPDNGRVEIRFDPQKPGTKEGREWIISKVYSLLDDIQGMKPKHRPADPLRWRGVLLVDPDPTVQPERDTVENFYRIGVAYEKLENPSQGKVAAEVGCTSANVGKWEDKMWLFLKEKKFPHCTVGALTGVGTGKQGITKNKLSEYGQEAMQWSEVWFTDLPSRYPDLPSLRREKNVDK